mgnify:CR=1 FL=1
MESILTSIKKMLGPTEDYEHFDPELIMHINSALAVATQVGVGPAEGFFIKDKNAVWEDLAPEGPMLELTKTYVYAKVKLIFDPPTTGSHVEALKETIREYEWRASVAADSQ